MTNNNWKRDLKSGFYRLNGTVFKEYNLQNKYLLNSNQLVLTHLQQHRKDFEISQLSSRIEDEQAMAAQLQKKLKELQVKFLIPNKRDR